MNHSVESLDNEDSEAGKMRYSSTKEPLLEFVKIDSGRMRIANRRAELDLLCGWIAALRSLNSGKKEKVWIPNLGGWFLITGMHYLQKCCHKDFEVVAPGRNPNFFTIVIRTDGSSI